MPGITKEEDKFQSLVQALSDKLGPCSGIDSNDVDEKELQQLMENYVSDESEWAKYFFPAPSVPYTRNLVDKGNGKSNLVRPLGEYRCLQRLTLEADSGMVTWQRKSYSRVSSFVHDELTQRHLAT
jgi:hypothetical protein